MSHVKQMLNEQNTLKLKQCKPSIDYKSKNLMTKKKKSYKTRLSTIHIIQSRHRLDFYQFIEHF